MIDSDETTRSKSLFSGDGMERQAAPNGDSLLFCEETWDSSRINELKEEVSELIDCIKRLRREMRVGIQKDTGARLCILPNSGTRKIVRDILSAPERPGKSRGRGGLS